MSIIRTGSLLLLLMLASGCASNHTAQQQAEANKQQFADEGGDPRDKIESVNRLMWDINYDILDQYILRPLTIGYTTVTPDFVRSGLRNAIDNLNEPSNTINNMLQGKPSQGLDSLARFILNSTVGVFGLFDVAGAIGIERQEEAFGEVLGVWGADTGTYVMLPALGPSDVRSFSGDVVDNLYWPLTILNTPFNIARVAIGALESRAAVLSQDAALRNSPDAYAFVRSAYFQNLEFKVKDGEISDEEEEFDEAAFEEFLEDID
ncbi:MlaA family lipoprotein [Aestuariibacter salexigens]|uniref:MlaA family lipoprotein n=1 Tax=Aestuariibacter salexigens TaxID=226010 RepID=UPI00040CA30A|nr:VacJ family lipoprotein [Aestuariibacter salexigens]